MIQRVKKYIPQSLISAYHYAIARISTWYYGNPTREMIIIGITGTKGKTSTANFIWSVLTAGGYMTGLIGTANIRIGDKESLNTSHMTMPGRFALGRILRNMKDTGCRYAIVETTSEGIKQWRHIGIAYDILIFTNISPEHLQSHLNSFEEYKKTKGRLFENLATMPRKVISGKSIAKIIIANADSPEQDYFLSFSADKKITFGSGKRAFVQANNIQHSEGGVSFMVDGDPYTIVIPGVFNVYNALPAIIIGRECGIRPSLIQKGLLDLVLIPGRMEKIDEGEHGRVFVDYAHERESMTLALEAARGIAGATGHVIVLLGAEGGGRDKQKRPQLGEVAAKKADYVIVSNVDPYDDSPTDIAEDIARAAQAHGKRRDQNLFIIEDRREGIHKALTLAKTDDVVMVTGKGAEQTMIIGDTVIPWDDRVVVRQVLGAMHESRPKF